LDGSPDQALIPNAFRNTGLAFGIGYFIVILVHGFMYVRAVGWKAARFVPMNFLSAATVIIAGFVDGSGRYLLWLLAIVFHVITSFLGQDSARTAVSHYERHGLLLRRLGDRLLRSVQAA
jgi:low temperature requirement protein LtrA